MTNADGFRAAIDEAATEYGPADRLINGACGLFPGQIGIRVSGGRYAM
ncbi:MAG: hypothetical protein AAF982_12480 [Pseudomonadota bacterium]